MPARVEPCLDHLKEHLARTTILVLANGGVALAVRHAEGEGRRDASTRQTLANRTPQHVAALGLGQFQGGLELVDLGV